MIEGRTSNVGVGGGGGWGVSGPCKAPGATAALKKDKARASSGFTATTKSKLSLLISFQSLRDATFTSEEAVCCCHHRRCCCSKVSPQCRVDLRKKKKQKNPWLTRVLIGCLRRDSSDTESRPSGSCQRGSRATKTKRTAKGNCHDNLGTLHRLHFQERQKKKKKGK